MILLIDNYDSFTYNLVHYLYELGAEVKVVRNDKTTPAKILQDKSIKGIVMSPGPCTPDEAGICLDLVDKLKGKIPILGVCLGHQTIGQVFGAKVIRAPKVMHGKTSRIFHEGRGVFANLPTPFVATRYHSLILDDNTIPSCLKVTAKTKDGIIMGIEHEDYNISGVQFHPESIASENGHDILRNFLKR